jgi:hypothetical protein
MQLRSMQEISLCKRSDRSETTGIHDPWDETMTALNRTKRTYHHVHSSTRQRLYMVKRALPRVVDTPYARLYLTTPIHPVVTTTWAGCRPDPRPPLASSLLCRVQTWSIHVDRHRVQACSSPCQRKRMKVQRSFAPLFCCPITVTGCSFYYLSLSALLWSAVGVVGAYDIHDCDSSIYPLDYPVLSHLQSAPSIPNYKTFNFFYPKFDHSSYSKNLYKHS